MVCWVLWEHQTIEGLLIAQEVRCCFKRVPKQGDFACCFMSVPLVNWIWQQYPVAQSETNPPTQGDLLL